MTWEEFVEESERERAQPLPWQSVRAHLKGATHIFVEAGRISTTKRGQRTDIVLEGAVAESIAYHLQRGAEPPRIGKNGPCIHFR